MRLTTWNVNGIRNPFGYQPWNSAKTFPAMFDILGSDIVVMQELKIQQKDLRDEMVLLDGWDCYFSLPKHKKGYSGVGIYTRNAVCAPVKAEEGLLGVLPSRSGISYCELPEDECIGGYPNLAQLADLGVDAAALDAEGRCVVLEFPAFVIFGVYCPANSNGLRDDFRHGFICALDCRLRNLVRAGKRVVLVGDLNVSRDELDGASAAEDNRKAGITHEQYISTPNRRIFNQLLIGGEVVGERDEGRERGILWDTTRAFHPERKGMYTHWETKINARPGNYGSRIDFVLVSESMQSWIKDANTQDGLLGSDHCPVFVDFNNAVQLESGEVNLLDLMNPPGWIVSGSRVQEWRVQNVPPFSAKRLPEFDKRRSIKSMFAAPSLSKAQSSANDMQSGAPTTPPASGLARDSEKPSTTTFENAVEDVQSVGVTPEPSQSKRKPSQVVSFATTKRQKVGSEPPKLKNQKSLKSFFTKGKADGVAATVAPVDGSAAAAVRPRGQRAETMTAKAILTDGPSIDSSTMNDNADTSEQPAEDDVASPSSTASFTASPSNVLAKVAAAEQNQRTWGALFSRPAAPLCESHNEPCKTMLTKKSGFNKGRSFWMCARPLGPKGEKERGTQWRCPTFIWCSDWQGRKEDDQAEARG